MALGDTAELLEDIRERGSIPSADLRFTDARLLKAATLELREGCVPLLHAAKAEYLVTPYSVAVTPGVSEYRIPPKAIGGGGLRDAVWQTTGGQPVSLREFPVEEVPMWGTSQGTPVGYYPRGYAVVLLPAPNVNGTLSLPYYARPNALADASTCFSVLDVASDTQLLFAGEAMTDYLAGATAAGRVLDAVRGTPCFESLGALGAVSWGFDATNTTVTYSSSVGEVAAGDWLCPLGTSPVVQLPVEMLGLLAVRTARRALKAAGEDRWQALDADVAELEARAIRWLSPRNDGEVVSVSPLSSGLFRGVLGPLI